MTVANASSMCWASLFSLICSSCWSITEFTWCSGSRARIHLLSVIWVLGLKGAPFHHRWRAATKQSSSQHLSLISCTLHRSSKPGVRNTGGLCGKDLSCPNYIGCLSVVQPGHRAADVLLLSLMQSSLSTLNQTCLEYWWPADSLNIPMRESEIEIKGVS